MKITDKLLHFSISFLLFSTVYLYCFLLQFRVFWCLLIAFVITLLVGVTKEIMDEKCDWKDLLADVIGIIVSMGIIIVLLCIF